MIIPRRYIDMLPGELGMCSKRPDPVEDRACIDRWEAEFAGFIGRRSAISVGSGRLAMKLILSSLALAPGSEVIIPAYTLKDLLPIIRSLGLVPVPADIDPATWNVSPQTITKRLSLRTKAILALHLFGNPCPMPEIMTLAKAHGLKVIEDCAHSAGSTIGGRQTGAFGVAAFFSFEAIKPINTYGGGMVVADDPAIVSAVSAAVVDLAPPKLTKKMLAVRLERFLFATGLAIIPLGLLSSPKAQGLMTTLYRQIQHAPKQPLGYAPLQAALGLRKLATLERRISRKRQQAELLKSLLPASCQPQQCCEGGLANYYFYVIKAPGDVQQLRRQLLFHGFDGGYGHEIADDCAALLNDTKCPEAADLYQRAIHLPLHEGMDDRQIERLARLLRQAC